MGVIIVHIYHILTLKGLGGVVVRVFVCECVGCTTSREQLVAGESKTLVYICGTTLLLARPPSGKKMSLKAVFPVAHMTTLAI